MEHNSTYEIGGKAKGLFFLEKNGFNVPPFFVLNWEEIQKEFSEIPTIQASKTKIDPKQLLKKSEGIRNKIIGYKLSEKFIDRTIERCVNVFGENFFVSVRSSGASEDSVNSSFAGMYTTALFVTKTNLEENIKKCIASGWSDNALQYMHLKKGGIETPKMSIVIQKMVSPKCAGVIFTRNPNGNLNNLIITAGYGVGEGIVSGRVETDTFYVDRLNGNVSEIIATKNTKLTWNPHSPTLLAESVVNEQDKKSPTLRQEEVNALAEIGSRAEKLWGMPLDIEFAVDEKRVIHLLQARPITTIELERVKILDNTNISESYPGLTLPLSISFAKNNYYQVFNGTAAAIGVNISSFPEMENVLSNLIGSSAGRVYYRLENWYRMMSLIIPGKKSLKNWESSVGLRNGNIKPPSVSLFSRINSFQRFSKFLIFHKKWSRNFFTIFNSLYQQLIDYSLEDKSAKEIFLFHTSISQKLYSNWYPTLVNDLLAFKSFGKLKSIVQSLGFNANENIANDLLCGIEGVESEKPLLELLNLVEMVRTNGELLSLFVNQNSEFIYKTIVDSKESIFSKLFLSYLALYGDRTTAELKLETKSFRDDPRALVDMIKIRLESDSTSEKIKQKQLEIRTNAERAVEEKFSSLSIKKFYFHYVLSLARHAIRNRENMRFCRTRAYGAVKDQFKAIGNEMFTKKIIAKPEDIFYLTLEQIEKYCIEGNRESLFEYVMEQKSKYLEYEGVMPSDRIMYTDENPPMESIGVIIKGNSSSELQGIGVSKGQVTADALVVDVPDPRLDVKGKIVVTRITDPGWVFIMSQAAGLVSEKGSLLSHTAIVGRELGIPTIVGVANAASAICTGDTVYIDGSLGVVKIVKKVLDRTIT
jgi:pyruvate,water dikinase